MSFHLPPVDRDLAAAEAPGRSPSLDGAAPPLLASPCIGTCRIEPRTGWCLGCARTREELAAWRDLDAMAKRRVWALLPERKARLGLGFRLEPWSAAEALARLARAIEAARRTVRMGPWVSLVVDSVHLRSDGLELRGAAGRILLRSEPALRVFRLVDRAGERVLAVPRVRVPPATGLVGGGAPDAAAIDPADRAGLRFDLGLVADAASLAVRTADRPSIERWRRQVGRPFDPAASPDGSTWIVSTPIGRAELTARPNLATAPLPRALPDSYAACLTC